MSSVDIAHSNMFAIGNCDFNRNRFRMINITLWIQNKFQVITSMIRNRIVSI